MVIRLYKYHEQKEEIIPNQLITGCPFLELETGKCLFVTLRDENNKIITQTPFDSKLEIYWSE